MQNKHGLIFVAQSKLIAFYWKSLDFSWFWADVPFRGFVLRRCSNSAHAALHPSLRSTAQSFEQGDLAACEAWIY